jgi:hypothetical protein
MLKYHQYATKSGRPTSAKRKSGATPRSNSAMAVVTTTHTNGSVSGATANGSPVLRRNISGLADFSTDASAVDDDEAIEDVDKMDVDEPTETNADEVHENGEEDGAAVSMNGEEDAEGEMDVDEDVDAEGEEEE